jgi:ABC-type polysaccharide/polyol phosphate export permease
MLDVAAQIGFFLTPIMYRRNLLDDRGLGWIVDINPANLYLSLIRDPLIGNAPAVETYLSAVALTAVLVALAAGVVGWLHKKVIFHL